MKYIQPVLCAPLSFLCPICPKTRGAKVPTADSKEKSVIWTVLEIALHTLPGYLLRAKHGPGDEMGTKASRPTSHLN